MQEVREQYLIRSDKHPNAVSLDQLQVGIDYMMITLGDRPRRINIVSINNDGGAICFRFVREQGFIDAASEVCGREYRENVQTRYAADCGLVPYEFGGWNLTNRIEVTEK